MTVVSMKALRVWRFLDRITGPASCSPGERDKILRAMASALNSDGSPPVATLDKSRPKG